MKNNQQNNKLIDYITRGWKRTSKFILLSIGGLFLTILIFTGCDSGGNDDDDTPTFDIRGTWEVVYQWDDEVEGQTTVTFSGDSTAYGSWTDSWGYSGTWSANDSNATWTYPSTSENPEESTYTGQIIDSTTMSGTILSTYGYTGYFGAAKY